VLARSYLKYILQRFAQAVPLVFTILILNFFLIHAAPGDPVYMLMGEVAVDQEEIARLREEFGLNKPLYVQLGTYIGKVVKFDLGSSFRYRQKVLSIILSRMPATLLLMGSALIFASIFGILLGAIAAQRPYGLADNVATISALIGYSMPVFWLGQLLLLVFAFHLNWLPTQGMFTLRVPSVGWARILDLLKHLILPAVTYGVFHLTLIFRLTRVKMQDVLAEDYVTTARAKGVHEHRVVYSHALRNAMLPIVTIIGLNFAFMMAGSVLTETVFAWPGMGRLMYEAVSSRDYPVLLGLFYIISIMVILVNITTDIIYAFIDPRVVYK
jgi:ABC-type dipeptide/oligopeptide/nickel transport system permease component